MKTPEEIHEMSAQGDYSWMKDPDLHKKFDKELARLDTLFAPRIEAFRRSENLTEEDFRIVINAKG